MGGVLKGRKDPLEDIRKGQAEAADTRRKLLERQRAQQMMVKKAMPSTESRSTAVREASPFDHMDVERTIAAAEGLRLMTLGAEVGPPTALNRPSTVLLREFLETLRSRDSLVLLQWPFGQRDISVLHPLAMTELI